MGFWVELRSLSSNFKEKEVEIEASKGGFLVCISVRSLKI